MTFDCNNNDRPLQREKSSLNERQAVLEARLLISIDSDLSNLKI